jgi:hypothetical protein
MGLFWVSADGNNGTGVFIPTLLSSAWRPPEEIVAIVAAVIGRLLTIGHYEYLILGILTTPCILDMAC